MKHSVSGVGVLDKAVDILGALEGGPLDLAGLVEATGLSRATAHRLASALVKHGLVARAQGGFDLGPRLAELGTAAGLASGPSGLVEASRAVLEGLRDATGESAQLYVPAGEGRLCIASLQSPHGLRTIVPVGAVLPMDKGSAGKVLSPGVRPRGAGWVESVEEREKGVASVSAPVWRQGRVVAAVSVSGPVGRTTRAPGRRYGTSVARAAREIEHTCGWS